ncbi:flagellar biosynthetic protein FliO [Pseudogracilibacillus auburnensis]|uniref:flagellar biosynthetic protein FliO n=1 Tax=Pseudogracilibacillus auburnensis TaxID=1494959 RepID=UPI001A965A23|nr:flagellar biosynthetic protein FliO [Pseudogracilibacillus auburnensis]MBO1003795.1 flagellar biosynthetic protein FliO [Pseudogracilibacillus auburnensis]
MGRKISFIILFSAMISLFVATNISNAEVKNVKDCLEASEDCEELKQPVQGDSNHLVEDEPVPSTSIVMNFIKMIFALLLVLALIYFILTFIKKRNRLFSNVHVLENLGGITVGTNKSIQLVRIGAKVYLIGVGDNVEMLQEITDEEIVHTLLEEEEQNAQSSTFIGAFLEKGSFRSDEKNKQFTSTLEKELNKIKDKRHRMIHHMKEKDDRHG